MKKKLFLSMLLATAMGFFYTSCSSSDDSNDDGNGNGNTISTRYQHKVLIEDATGTWCQFCPRVAYAIEQAKANNNQGNNVVAVAIHSGVQSYPDPMQITASNSLINLFSGSFGLEGFPFGLINRTATFTYPEPNNLAQVFNSINQDGSTVGIKISSSLTQNGGTVNASFKFSESFNDLKYSIFIIENEVVTPNSPQSNTTGYYGGQGANFIHNDVLRGVSGFAIGNSLGDVTSNQEINKSDQAVTYTLFNNDLSKVEIVVFITDSTGKVLNVQTAHANETIDYNITKQ